MRTETIKNTVTARSVVRSARGMIGTPWVHQGRLPGVGLDCVGLPLVVCRELDVGDFDSPALRRYQRFPSGDLGIVGFLERITERREGEPRASDILVFWVERGVERAHHVGIMAETRRDRTTFVHASDKVRRVRECTLDADWRKRLLGSYRFPGVR